MKKTKTKVLLPYHFDFCSKLGLQSKLSEPPNGGNYGQNCFADPGRIHSHKDKKIAEKEDILPNIAIVDLHWWWT